MKKILLLGLAIGICGSSWADATITAVLTEKIGPNRITPAVLQSIERDILLIDTRYDDLSAEVASTLDDIFSDFAPIMDYYVSRDIPKPVLGYILEHETEIRDTCASLTPSCIRIVHILSAYQADIQYRYSIHIERDTAARESLHSIALEKVPENVIVPDAPASDTYQAIVVDISKQLLFAYEDGVLVYVTPVTTGKRGFSTPLGTFEVQKKQQKKLLKSPFKNISYSLHVDYWVQFAPSYGFHDACNNKSCWRTQFGGKDFVTRGSHGCVNMPYDAVKWLSDWALIGSTVLVQK